MALAMLLLVSVDAYAHNVAEGDKGYIQESSGVIFFLYRMKDVGIYVTLFAIGHSTTLLFGVLTGISANAFLIDAIIGQAAHRTSRAAASGRRGDPARSRAQSFFARNPATVEEPPQGADPDMHALPRKTRLDLGQRDITILIEHRHDQIGMGAGLRGTLIATGLASNGAAMFACHLPPTDRRSDPNPKTSGRGSATHPGFRRRNNPIP